MRLAYSLLQWLRRQKAIFEFWLGAQSPLFCATSFDALPQGVQSGTERPLFCARFCASQPFFSAAALNSKSRAYFTLAALLRLSWFQNRSIFSFKKAWSVFFSILAKEAENVVNRQKVQETGARGRSGVSSLLQLPSLGQAPSVVSRASSRALPLSKSNARLKFKRSNCLQKAQKKTEWFLFFRAGR